MIHRYKKSLIVSVTALNAALYAIGAYTTAYIESPWGHGQFRPAIIIPAIFATIFGPWVGGVGAAIGTLIADSIKHRTLYIPSLIAAVPANFIAFYIYGKMLEKKFSWTNFIISSIIALITGNFICAVLLVAYYTYIIPIFLPKFYSQLVLGFTAWWYITMIPFQLLVAPIIIRAIARAIPSMVPKDVLNASLSKEMPTLHFSLALLLPGLLMLSIGIITLFEPSIAISLVGVLRNAEVIASLIQYMFLLTGGCVSILGLALLITHKLKV